MSLTRGLRNGQLLNGSWSATAAQQHSINDVMQKQAAQASQKSSDAVSTSRPWTAQSGRHCLHWLIELIAILINTVDPLEPFLSSCSLFRSVCLSRSVSSISCLHHRCRASSRSTRILAAYRLPSWLLTDFNDRPSRLTHDLFLFCYTLLTSQILETTQTSEMHQPFLQQSLSMTLLCQSRLDQSERQFCSCT